MVLLAALIWQASALGAVLRVGAYNVLNNPDNDAEDAVLTTVLDAIGDQVVNGNAGRLDVLALSETDTGSSVRVAGLLNTLYGVSSYEVITSSSVGGDRTGLVYDTSSVSLQSFADITSIGVHPIVRGHFRPVGTQGEFDMYVYAVHLKSGSTSADRTARTMEAANLRADADALGDGTAVIYAGDFNLLGSSEGGWGNMLSAGSGQAFDPVNAPGEWRDDAAFRHLHTQNPRDNMDDRFDFQLLSGELLDGVGLDYVADSYRVFGNNGTHTLGDAIDTGTGASADVLSALIASSDHLPVVADYEFEVPEPASLAVLLVFTGFCARRGFSDRTLR